MTGSGAGCFAAGTGAQMLRVRQSSEAPGSWKTMSGQVRDWMQWEPKSPASRIFLHLPTGCGARQRRSAMGGWA